jgi:hypothetical protein
MKNICASDLIKHEDISWDESDLDIILQEIEDKVHQKLNELAPEKTKKIKEKQMKPWYNNTLRNKNRETRKLEKLWKKNNTPESLNHYKISLKKYNKEMLNAAKNQYATNAVNECGTNTKKLYSVISQLTNKSDENPLPLFKIRRLFYEQD